MPDRAVDRSQIQLIAPRRAIASTSDRSTTDDRSQIELFALVGAMSSTSERSRALARSETVRE
ncbi:hypothetical protein CFP66_34015 [Pseudonocardia sp. MH-G8]|nr:hypothetical protein CFP66_34015 [Pseudonocardia sp. MH-G8]